MNPLDAAAAGPLFTDADVTLVEDTIEREGEQISLMCEMCGIVIDPDDRHTRQLQDLAARLRRYVREHAPQKAP